MVQPSEYVCERETVSYAYGLHADVSSTDTAAQGADLDARAIPPSWAMDPALLAFAQLVSLRTNTARCLISLFDRERQYVVAEATATSPLAGKQDIWLGGKSIPRRNCICEHVLPVEAVPVEPGNSNGNGHGSANSLPVVVIPDLELDARFCNRSYIRGAPYNRFYAGTPIQSPNGINIGVLCVFDSSPRSGLCHDQESVLQNISHTIMRHIELRLLADRSERYERMIRGLGSFFDGDADIPRVSSDLLMDFRQELTVQDDLGTHNTEDWNKSSTDSLQRKLTPTPNRPIPTPVQSMQLPDASPSGELKGLDGTDTTDSGATVRTLASISSVVTAASSTDPVRKEIREVLSKAANFIRESLTVHAVAFLDARIGSFGGLVPGGSKCAGPSPYPAARQDIPTNGSPYMDDDTCPVLGCSTSIGDRLNQDGRSELNCLAVPERLLQRVLGHHPNGGIFELDSASELAVYGAHQRLAPGRRAATLRMVSGTDSTLTELTNDGTRQDLEDILACYPQARSVVLVPIWDPHAGQCLACCCVWSADPARHFTVKDDLGYLRAFGGAITFEFLRITSQLADASKNNLLESLSHELRSPLHGIVTSAELLHDTDLTAFQSDVLHSIESCGRTLIDVINHLLDYTKINRLANSTKEQSKNFGQPSLAAPQSPFESQLSRLSSNVEVDALVEETVESVFTGYRFLMPNAGIDGQDIRMAETRFSIFGESSTEPLAGDSDKETRYPTGGTTQEVSIYLDIVRHDSWLGLAQPGPLRRVIMNILGNSLKFTEKGFVHIQLDQEETVSGRSMKLTISDTGKGIDVEFLHRYLFEPFKQEDPLQPGTGLGLSLVSQILEGLGGSIHIESQKGLGTVAHIAVPFPRSRENADHDSVLHRHVSALKNLRVSLHELDHAKVPCLGNLVPFEASLLMRNLFENWLQLEVISSQSTDTRPDILVCTELSVEQLVTANAGLSLPPVVVICRSAMTAYELGKTYKNLGGGAVLVFISQPAGPRKLAKALILALERHQTVRNADVLYEGPSMAIDQWSSSSVTALTPNPDSIIGGAGSCGTPLSPMDSSPFDVACGEANSTLPPLPTTEVSPRMSRNGPMKYLLVDDNKINIKILVAFMNKSKREWTSADNGLEALEAYMQSPESYAGILMDLSMPVMDGLEASRQIRELERLKTLPNVTIIALTGIASASAQQEAFASGIDLFMTKPVRLKELAEILAKNEGMASK